MVLLHYAVYILNPPNSTAISFVGIKSCNTTTITNVPQPRKLGSPELKSFPKLKKNKKTPPKGNGHLSVIKSGTLFSLPLVFFVVRVPKPQQRPDRDT